MLLSKLHQSYQIDIHLLFPTRAANSPSLIGSVLTYVWMNQSFTYKSLLNVCFSVGKQHQQHCGAPGPAVHHHERGDVLPDLW